MPEHTALYKSGILGVHTKIKLIGVYYITYYITD